VLLTVIKRNIRKYVNPAFTISFDCASPFLATANGQVYFENVFPDNGKWSYRMAPSADDKKYATDTRKWSDGVVADGKYPRWEDSPLSDLFKMKDICYYKPGDLNKNGKEGKTSWDSFSYALMMGHNVECHIKAVQRAQQLMDIECARFKPDWRMKSIEGKKEIEYSDWVPNKILYFSTFIEELFNTKDKQQAFDLIDSAKLFLKSLEGARLQGGPADNVFNDLFVTENASPVRLGPDGLPLFDQQDDDKLNGLVVE
jgi:hypothetical protein